MAMRRCAVHLAPVIALLAGLDLLVHAYYILLQSSRGLEYKAYLWYL